MRPDGYASPEANDIRFQYEVIKNLADSVREQSKVMSGIQSTQVGMLERLARIEANRVNEDVAKLGAVVDRSCERINALESDKDIRDGGSKMRRATITWWPVIAATFTVFYLLFRATGILHLPSDDQKPPIVVPMQMTPRDKP